MFYSPLSNINNSDISQRRSSPIKLPEDFILHSPQPTMYLDARLSPHTLPHLSIPPQVEDNERPPVDVAETPVTPVSLGSPSTVIDLTKDIRTIHGSPVKSGGFSDIYRGTWTTKLFNENDGKGGSVHTVYVAIKLLRILAAKDPDYARARKRLNREVYVWHRLEHPNIAKLFGTSYHMNDRPSMVMRWYNNGSAVDYLRSRSTGVDKMSLVLDIAQGLNYLHTLPPNPIVHGDLKGNNVLITDDGRGVLSDFGLSQVIEDLVGPTGFTPSGPEIGPIRWQAPELIEDESCQPGLETDVWSFGCTTYELLTGNIPYHYRVRDAQVIKDMGEGIKPPGIGGVISSNRKINELLCHLCWSFVPSDRPQMAEIVLRVQDILRSDSGLNFTIH